MRIYFFLLTCCFFLFGCTRQPTNVQAVSKRESVDCDVLLISLDTLRADHLSMYGYAENTTPNLNALAAEGILFEHVYSPTPVTIASHMSIMTGLYPNHHNVFRPWIEKKIMTGLNIKNPLPGDVLSSDKTLLLEYAKNEGYKTLWMGGAPGEHMLSAKAGFQRGADHFINQSLQSKNDLHHFSSFIKNAQGKKIFAFVHSWRPHSAYTLPASANPEPIPGLSVTDESFLENVKKCALSPGCMNQRIKESGWLSVKEKISTLSDYGKYSLSSVKFQDREGVKKIIKLYDRAITYADGLIGELFSTLKKNGRWERSIVIVISDHGEEFFEHNWIGHAHLYEETIHVPFLLRVPPACSQNLDGNKHKRITSLGSLVDVTPTILSVLGIPASNGIDGRNLLKEQNASRAVFGYYWHGDRKRAFTYARGARYKVISEKMSNRFYDLSVDPNEKNPLQGQLPEEALNLWAKLRQFELEVQ